MDVTWEWRLETSSDRAHFQGGFSGMFPFQHPLISGLPCQVSPTYRKAYIAFKIKAKGYDINWRGLNFHNFPKEGGRWNLRCHGETEEFIVPLLFAYRVDCLQEAIQHWVESCTFEGSERFSAEIAVLDEMINFKCWQNKELKKEISEQEEHKFCIGFRNERSEAYNIWLDGEEDLTHLYAVR